MFSVLIGCKEQLGGGDIEVWERVPLRKLWRPSEDSTGHRVSQSREVKAERNTSEDIGLGC